MPIDALDTRVLNGAVEYIRPSEQFLLSAFFTRESRSTKEEISWDIRKNRRRLAPFVSPRVQGKVIKSAGFFTDTFRPAYIKDKRVFDAERPLKRAFGEPFLGTMSPGQRLRQLAMEDMAEQLDMLARREHVMAAEALRLGQISVSGEDYPAQVVNLQRDAQLSITLSGGARWNQAGVNPLTDLKTWALTMQKIAGPYPTRVVMEPNAFDAFVNNVAVKDRLNLWRTLNTPPSINPALSNGTIAQYHGVIDNFEIWTFQDFYEDDAGTTQQLLPDGTVFMVANPEGVRHYGLIKDVEAQLASLETTRVFVKSWTEKDPSGLMILMQSAPLPIPVKIDETLRATVL